MEKTMTKDNGMRRNLLAVIIFCGVSATAGQVCAADVSDEDDNEISISDESRQAVDVSEDISSAGNAVEFSASSVENFNLYRRRFFHAEHKLQRRRET